MPERLTPLWHTSPYATLTAEERLRYNQLHAFYFNEQIAFFEQSLAAQVLSHFSGGQVAGVSRDSVASFVAEEERHAAMFLELNRRAAPEIYPRADFRFIRIPRGAGFGMNLAARLRPLAPVFLWLLMIQEERSLYYSRLFLAEAPVLEENFVAVHRFHMQEEARHVVIDEKLLDGAWPAMGGMARFTGVRLFGMVMREFFGAPKRAGLRVLRRLALEFPALRPRLPELLAALRALDRSEAHHRTLYSREIVPRTFARLDRHPEFRGLSRWLPGYDPGEARG